MFLIEYDAGEFVNATEINRLIVNEKRSKFSINGDTNTYYIIGADYCKTFFNHLQSLNDNITNIESCWHKLKT